jgi:hypothetical protein
MLAWSHHEVESQSKMRPEDEKEKMRPSDEEGYH